MTFFRVLCLGLLLAACGGRIHVGGDDDAGPPGDGSVSCGVATCSAGLVCCNASCGICAEPGMGCSAIACVEDCASNGDCAPTDYCLLPGGTCPTVCAIPEGCSGTPRPGICSPRPTACLDIEAPVCGCDSVTYGNSCEAAAAGATVRLDGACEMPMCMPDDARGEGACAAIVGLAFDGERCATLSGCSCVGADCGRYNLGDEVQCELDHPGCASCAPADARGVGPCFAEFGVAFDGAQCVGIGGCTCEGTDCDTLYASIDQCVAAHAHCGGGTRPCASSRECGLTEFCYFADGECGTSGDPLGECRDLPPELPCPADAEVCACNGVTFACEAEANASGLSILGRGACTTGVSCGGPAGATCGPTELCDYPPGDACGVLESFGVCRLRPAGCIEIIDPVCGCDRLTYNNECLANQAGVDRAPDTWCTDP